MQLGITKPGHMWTECMAISLAGLWDLQYLPEVYTHFKKVAVACKGKLSYLCGLEKEAISALSVCCICSSRKGWNRNLSALAESRFSFYLICTFALLLYHLIGHIDNVCFRNEAWVSISQPDSQSVLWMCAFSLQRSNFGSADTLAPSYGHCWFFFVLFSVSIFRDSMASTISLIWYC